jgi:hypothetical protein
MVFLKVSGRRWRHGGPFAKLKPQRKPWGDHGEIGGRIGKQWKNTRKAMGFIRKHMETWGCHGFF